MEQRKRSWWGWGWADQAVPRSELEGIAAILGERLGRELEVRDPARIEDLDLPTPRLQAPASLSHLASVDPEDRARHAYGNSFRDVVRAFRGDVASPPDVVMRPGTEAEVTAVLEWCAEAGAAVVPHGGGSSVVGGVETGGAWAEAFAGVVTLDLERLSGVRELDRTGRAARIAGGTYGPALEDELRPHGLTLRHYPQSFEFSTLGGWLATRAGGHYATNRTHIDDFVESIRAVTPRGVMESRRLPGSGAGPSPDRLLLGSEGTLGIITEAWMRLQERPRFRAKASVLFPTFALGVAAARALAQSDLFPTNCRLLDPGEATNNVGTTDGSAVLVLGFESAHHPVDGPMALAMELCSDHGGVAPGGVRIDGPSATGGGDDTSDRWKDAFLRMPYLRDAMVAVGCVAETFETAVPWDRFEELHAGVSKAAEETLGRLCGGGTLTCRFTHVYPDGPAPYYTVLAPSDHGSQLAAWDEVKAAVSEALIEHGGTITHHHAVGRDHRPWYDRQRPELFAGALGAVKDELDPSGMLNPEVLMPSRRAV